ncbi:MAG: VWA domain-containing protein [Planctomycetes bacterium]|nr:VWA domain-containing protein [Planctomycetota bacterium]
MSLAAFLAWPAGVPLLLLVPLAWLGLRASDRARARRLATVVGARSAVLAAEAHGGERRARRTVAALALGAGLLALLQPLWGEGARRDPRGVDVVVCLDVSRSMLATDVAPSRLQAARREIQVLAERVRGDRLGLVVFAGEARLLVPLTRDLGSFAELVELAEPTSVRRGGTDLGAALATALAALRGAEGDHAAVLLLSDGEDHEQRGLRAVEALAERGIAVHCVGLGTSLGSKIPVQGGDGATFLRDAAGREVISALDPAGLRSIAERSGGGYVDAAARPLPLVGIYERRILPTARTAVAAQARDLRENRFQWPLLIAVLLWMLDLVLTERRSRRPHEHPALPHVAPAPGR